MAELSGNLREGGVVAVNTGTTLSIAHHNCVLDVTATTSPLTISTASLPNGFRCWIRRNSASDSNVVVGALKTLTAAGETCELITDGSAWLVLERGTTSVAWDDVTDKPTTFPPDAHNHDTAYEPKNANIQSHIANTSNPHSVTATQVGLGSVTNDAQVKRSEMGAVSGVATLGADGKVPSTQLPVIDSITAFRRGWFGC